LSVVFPLRRPPNRKWDFFPKEIAQLDPGLDDRICRLYRHMGGQMTALSSTKAGM
jgi:hypothetical protein